MAKNSHIQRSPSTNVTMKELTTSQREEAERTVRTLLRNTGKIDLQKVGAFLLEQVEAGRAINDVQEEISGKKDFYKRKSTLLQVEYLALILIQKS